MQQRQQSEPGNRRNAATAGHKLRGRKEGIEMEKAYILNMAMGELLRKREAEQDLLRARPESEISQNRLAKHDAEIDELHGMILEAEQAEDDRLPPGYVEIEYDDLDSPEARAGCRFDDLNYQRYMER